MRPHSPSLWPAALPLAALALCACGPSFDPPELLASPRLLAVLGEPPELGPGEKTTLAALHFPPTGESTIDWAYCTKGTSINAATPTALDCVQNDTAPYLFPIGTGETVDFTMPTLDETQLGVPDYTLGVYLPIRVRLKTPEKTETGIFRLRFHSPKIPLPKNQNPKLLGLYQVPTDGSAPETGPTSQPLDEKTPLPWDGKKPLKLRTALAEGSQETYMTFEGDLTNPTIKTATETIDFQWYADAGAWTPPTTGPERPDTEFHLDPKKDPPPVGTKINLYVIARDERGGAAWLHRVVEYRP